MNPRSTPTPLIVKIANYLPLAEKAFLIALVVGTGLKTANIDSIVMYVSLAGLAVVLFLFAYRVVDLPHDKDEVYGFKELLGYMIIPKILWISCAISVLGVLLHFINNKGSDQLFFIGGTTIAIGTVLLILLLITGLKHVNVVIPVLYRAIPMLVIDLYLFSN